MKYLIDARWSHAVAALSAAVFSISVEAQSTWTGASSTDWNTVGNWTPATLPSTSVNATLGSMNVLADQALSVSSATNIRNITFDGPVGYSVSGASLNMTSTPTVVVSAGSLANHTISNLSLAGTTALTITNNGALGSLEVNGIGGSGTGTVTYGGVGQTVLSGTVTSGNTVINAGAKVSFDGAGQFGGSTVTVNATNTATSNGMANRTLIQNRAAVDFAAAGKTLAFGNIAGGTAGSAVLFDAQADFNTNASALVTTQNTSLGFYNTGSGTVTLNGVTHGNATGAVAYNFNSGKFSLGNVTFNGTNSANRVNVNGGQLTITGTLGGNATGSGRVAVRGGTAVFDYTGNAGTKFTATTNALTIGAGSAVFKGHTTTDTTETLSGLNVGSGAAPDQPAVGAGKVVVNAGANSSFTLNLGTITRTTTNTAQSTVDFVITGNGTITTTNSNGNGIVGPWATFGGNNYATVGAGNAIGGYSAYDATTTNRINNTNSQNITLALGSSANLTSTTLNAYTTRVTQGGELDLGNRSFSTTGTLISGEVGASDVTITSSNSTLSLGTIIQNNTQGKLIVNGALSSGFTKSGGGELRLNNSSAMNSLVIINDGKVSLGADGALGTGSLHLRGGATFEAIGGERLITNNTGTSTAQQQAGFRAIQFVGDHSFRLTGIWQSPDGNGHNYVPASVKVNTSAGTTIKVGENSTGTWIIGDTNGGVIEVTGTGEGDLRFYNPVLGTPGTSSGTFVVDRTGGATIFDKSNSFATLAVRQGVVIVKDGTSASAVTKAFSSPVTGSNTVSFSDLTGLNVGMSLQTGTGNATLGTFITAIDTNTNTITLSRSITTSGTTLAFQGIGTAGRNAAIVEEKGVLGLGANIALPSVDSSSRGTIGIETSGYTQNINQSALGNGAMFLGSATGGTISDGTLTAGSGSTYRLGGGGNTLTIGKQNYLTGANHLVVGDGSLYKGTSTTIILSEDQDYSGNTVVRAGKWVVNADKTGTGLVIVDQGATLGGSGTIAGNTTIRGTHTPGNSPGVQGFSGNLTYDATASFAWELEGNTEAGRGTTFDGVDMTGVAASLTIAGGATFNVTLNGAGSGVNFGDAFWLGSRSWKVFDLVDSGSSITGTFLLGSVSLDSVGNSHTGFGAFNLAAIGNDLYLQWTASVIPEPATYAAMAGVFILGLAAYRRRPRSAIRPIR